MSESAITVTTWAPSARQEPVLQRFGLGYSWSASAQLCKVPLRTVQTWCEDPEFVALGWELRRQVRESIEPRFNGLIERALDVQMRVGDGDGDLSPDSKLAKWAERILERTLFRVVVARAGVGAGAYMDGGRPPRSVPEQGSA